MTKGAISSSSSPASWPERLCLASPDSEADITSEGYWS